MSRSCLPRPGNTSHWAGGRPLLAPSISGSLPERCRPPTTHHEDRCLLQFLHSNVNSSTPSSFPRRAIPRHVDTGEALCLLSIAWYPLVNGRHCHARPACEHLTFDSSRAAAARPGLALAQLRHLPLREALPRGAPRGRWSASFGAPSRASAGVRDQDWRLEIGLGLGPCLEMRAWRVGDALSTRRDR